MLGLDALVNWVLDKFERVWPFAWVRPYEGGVRLRGKKYTVLASGFHRKLPWEEVERVNVRMQTLNLSNQKVTSKSGSTWEVSPSLTYTIEDVGKALVETQDFDESLATSTQDLIAAWLGERSDGEISVEAIREGVQRKVKYEAKRWGCEVERVGINTLVRAPTLIVSGIGG